MLCWINCIGCAFNEQVLIGILNPWLTMLTGFVMTQLYHALASVPDVPISVHVRCASWYERSLRTTASMHSLSLAAHWSLGNICFLRPFWRKSFCRCVPMVQLISTSISVILLYFSMIDQPVSFLIVMSMTWVYLWIGFPFSVSILKTYEVNWNILVTLSFEMESLLYFSIALCVVRFHL